MCVRRVPVSGTIEGFSFRYLIREAVHYLSDGWVTWPCCCQLWHLFVWTITDVFVIDNWVCALEQTYECLIAVVCVHILDRVCFRTHFTVLIHPAALCLLSRWTHYYDFSTAVRCLLYFCVKKTIEHKQKWYICALCVSGQACADQRKVLMENCHIIDPEMTVAGWVCVAVR